MDRWFVHGAGATARSFVWFAECLDRSLGDGKSVFFGHGLHETGPDVVARLRAQLDAAAAPIVLIGHSLGGLFAIPASASSNVDRVITLSAPFNGVMSAEMLRWFSNSPMFETIRPTGWFVRGVLSRPVHKPTLSIVSKSGMPHIREPNDGVVTVASQKALQGAIYHEADVNHSEVLLDDEVIERTAGFIRHGS